jgi:hypothetical protein
MKNDELCYLDLNELIANSRLMKLLPSDLALHYHAIPVAGTGNMITVAMADPSDSEARQAIMDAIGGTACFVRGNLKAIDHILSEFRKEFDLKPSSLIYWLPDCSRSAEFESYVQSLAKLLKIDHEKFETRVMGNQAMLELISEVETRMVDIVILGGIEQVESRDRANSLSVFNLVNRIPVSLLVVQSTRWPINYILLILRNGAFDESALDWAVRIAQPSTAEVAILPLAISPTMQNEQFYIHDSSVSTMLTMNRSLGKRLRLVARRFVDSGVHGTIVLRNEIPCNQIRFELMERNYDLVIIASEEPGQHLSKMPGDITHPLLTYTDRPVLITKPTITKRDNKNEF